MRVTAYTQRFEKFNVAALRRIFLIARSARYLPFS